MLYDLAMHVKKLYIHGIKQNIREIPSEFGDYYQENLRAAGIESKEDYLRKNQLTTAEVNQSHVISEDTLYREYVIYYTMVQLAFPGDDQ